MSQEQTPTEKKLPVSPAPVIHRVCIGCNAMFEVSPENYEAKHCPKCHKG